MPDTYFADASVLVKRHVNEIGSYWFSNLADSQTGNTIIISRLSLIEVISAFNRRCRELSLSKSDYQKISQDFESFCFKEYQIVEITQDITEKAKELLEKYLLRSGDAIQLASALLANEILMQANFSELTFLASDQRLLDAANAEKLQSDNPQFYP
jgi:predicted nucleic acid-binding protein